MMTQLDNLRQMQPRIHPDLDELHRYLGGEHVSVQRVRGEHILHLVFSTLDSCPGGHIPE